MVSNSHCKADSVDIFASLSRRFCDHGGENDPTEKIIASLSVDHLVEGIPSEAEKVRRGELRGVRSAFIGNYHESR